MNLAKLKHTLQNLGSSQVMSGFSTRERKKTTMKTQEQTHRSASLESPGAEAPAFFSGSWQPGLAVWEV